MQIRMNKGKEADYCCIDLPSKFITKPKEEWFCENCENTIILSASNPFVRGSYR